MEKSPFMFRNPKILVLELRLEELSKTIEPFVREGVEIPEHVKREIQYNLSEYDSAISDSIRNFSRWVRPMVNALKETNG